MNSEAVATQFSFIVSESTGMVCADESMRQLWTQFQCWILSRQRLGFPWVFQTQQGLCALTNPCVTYGSSFGYHFWVSSDSLFVNYFWVNRGCERWRIHASALEPVSVMISESAVSQFSLIISKSTGSMCAGESIRHLWKQFRWLFLRRRQLSLHWLFLSQQGQCALMNKYVTYGSNFINHFLVGNDSAFLDCFWGNGVLSSDKSMRQLRK